MNEATYKTQVETVLNNISRTKSVKVITGEMGRRGEPDIYGSLDGNTFVLEAKLEGNHPTQIQIERLDEWFNAGALALVITYPLHTPMMIRDFFVSLTETECYVPAFETREELQEWFEESIAEIYRFGSD